MRIIITADLHYGIGREYDEGVLRFLNSLKNLGEIDLLVIIGDVAEMIRLAHTEAGNNHREIFDIIKALPIKKTAFCAGNHDIWTTCDLDSWEIYTKILKGVANEYEITYLDYENFYIDNLAVVGTMGHYDYSMATPALEINGVKVKESHYRFKTPPGYTSPVWNDAKFIRWRYSDIDACEKICSSFEERLKEAMKQRSDKIIIATHNVPIIEMNGHRLNDNPISNFLNAFSGSTRLADIILRYATEEKSIRVFSAHTHFAVEPILKNGVEFQNVGGDYGKPLFIALEY